MYVGQVDLEGKPIFRWLLVGFWTGDLGVWGKTQTNREFFEICGSDQFNSNINL
jgi:hypothetical protein